MSVPPRSGSAPWGGGVCAVLAVSLTLAAALLTVSWWQSAGALRPGDQVIWTNAGVGAIVLEGVAVAVWLLAGRRAVGRRWRQLLGDRPSTPPRTPSRVPSAGVEVLVGLPGMRRYHRSRCPLVAGKGAQPVTVDAAVGRRPCGVCEPDRAGGDAR